MKAVVGLQSLFRARNARKSVNLMQEERTRTGGFPENKTEGWITKRGHIFRTWRKRWFVVEEGA